MFATLALKTRRTIETGAVDKNLLGVLLAAATVGGGLVAEPPAGLSPEGITFLGLLAGAVVLWLFEVFDEYIVALMLLLSWLLFDLVPPEIALGGFAQGPWFFALGALGMGAAVACSGLLESVSNWILNRVPARSRPLGLLLAGVGVVLTPLLPRAVVRMGGMVPITAALMRRIGAEPESSESAILALSSFAGSTVLTFMFLTGGTYCLVGWSLLPDEGKTDFNWLQWTLAGLPAGMLTLSIVLGAIFLVFPLRGDVHQSSAAVDTAAESEVTWAGDTKRKQWVTAIVVVTTVLAWITRPLHGVSESWVALGALILLLATGVLDRNGLKSHIDWGLLLFFGVAYSVASVVSHLHVDKWIMGLVLPYKNLLSAPFVFLLFVLLLTYLIRFFVLATPAIILVMVALAPWSLELGIHPGVLLLTALMGIESWIVPYQQISYLVAYNGNGTKPFSHRQARRIMGAKFVASILAVWVSVPYWSYLGLIEQTQVSAEARPFTAANHGAQPTERLLRPEAKRITFLQTRLSELGYEPGPIDGILGPRTRRAIEAFQRVEGLRPDGKTSRKLLQVLSKK